MDKIIIGYDDNLGLPNDFTQKVDCNILAFHDLAKMIAAFDQQNISAMFIPAGTLPYIDNYKIIAQAILDQKIKMQSNFVSTKNITVEAIPKNILGRVNQYCTTSYWSPLIYLMDFLPEKTILTFKGANSFQDMLHKTAEGIIDYSMVWNVILQQNPQDTNKVHQLFSKNDLPTPVIICKNEIDTAIKNQITQFISHDSKWFFNGFQQPDSNVVNKFIADMKKAGQYFQIKQG